LHDALDHAGARTTRTLRKSSIGISDVIAENFDPIDTLSEKVGGGDDLKQRRVIGHRHASRNA
jgi:hypothetical protein